MSIPTSRPSSSPRSVVPRSVAPSTEALGADAETTRTTTSATTSTTASTTTKETMATLMCSYVCHALVNPLGGLIAGVDLLDDVSGKSEVELVRTSATILAARLKFFRLAYGTAATRLGESIDWSASSSEFAASHEVTTRFAPTQAEFDDFCRRSSAHGKAAMTLLALALEHTPKAETLTIETKAHRLDIKARCDCFRALQLSAPTPSQPHHVPLLASQAAAQRVNLKLYSTPSALGLIQNS